MHDSCHERFYCTEQTKTSSNICSSGGMLINILYQCNSLEQNSTVSLREIHKINFTLNKKKKTGKLGSTDPFFRTPKMYLIVQFTADPRAVEEAAIGVSGLKYK